jgi:hypothetical protein
MNANLAEVACVDETHRHYARAAIKTPFAEGLL